MFEIHIAPLVTNYTTQKLCCNAESSYAAPGKLNLSKLSPKEMDIPLPVIGM